MHHQAGGDATHTDARQLLIGYPGVPGIDPLGDAAVLFRVTQAQQPHCSRLGPQFDWDMARLVPVLGVGHDLGIDEFAQLTAPLMMLFPQVGIGQTGTVKIKCTGGSIVS